MQNAVCLRIFADRFLNPVPECADAYVDGR